MRRGGERSARFGGGLPPLVLLAIALAACANPPPRLLYGDAKEARVAYAGDPGAATAVARSHCAQYERVPRLVAAEPDIAYFDCVRR